ncbi:carbon-phosphorus lyase complex subunit [Bradyrhizobium lupini HPC(L)]|uniref:Carbon-phosphorus lyase complex subunit n=1 Tax=Bradyrhizobium lupini HPC(L) TaxID=1229491 RepID=A0ABP2RML2_RHILU|nr:carbon-phosphorus lyase complex subunit [Bradyrhizobium lupini HPC(L)]
MIGIGADEHPSASVIQHHFIQIDIFCAAQRAGLVEALDFKRMILEIEADDVGVGRYGIDALLAPGAEQLQRVRHVHFRVVEFRGWRWIHHITPGHLHRIGVGGGDAAVAGNVLIELDVHQAIFLQRVHDARFGLARLEETQRLGNGYLIDKHLAGMQFLFRNAVPRLDDGGILRSGRDGNIRHLLEEGADRNRIGRVIGAWSITFSTSSGPRMEAVNCTPPVPQP